MLFLHNNKKGVFLLSESALLILSKDFLALANLIIKSQQAEGGQFPITILLILKYNPNKSNPCTDGNTHPYSSLFYGMY